MTAGKVFLCLIESFAVISMHNVALFVEDYAHQQVIGAVVKKLADESDLTLNLQWRSSVKGYGRVVSEFDQYLRDLEGLVETSANLIVVATDANCKGFHERAKELQRDNLRAPIIQAIPDPHIERWLLLDGAAFRAVFGKGCAAPDLKCSRNHYKQMLTAAIREAGVNPSLGGIEFAGDIVDNMDIKRAARSDDSFRRFVESILAIFRIWKL